MKRAAGTIEAIFDISYLAAASILSVILLSRASGNSVRLLAGVMALVLVAGDAFHLVPRILVILTGKQTELQRMLGRGKQITSITMTLFYVILCQIGLLIFSPQDFGHWYYTAYFLAIVRIFLCLLPQNKWADQSPPVSWGIWRNVPFFLLGILVAGLFFMFGDSTQGLSMMWLAIGLSFAFYLPVVLWANKNPKFGMLMLPKTCVYLWMLAMCLSI